MIVRRTFMKLLGGLLALPAAKSVAAVVPEPPMVPFVDIPGATAEEARHLRIVAARAIQTKAAALGVPVDLSAVKVKAGRRTLAEFGISDESPDYRQYSWMRSTFNVGRNEYHHLARIYDDRHAKSDVCVTLPYIKADIAMERSSGGLIPVAAEIG